MQLSAIVATFTDCLGTPVRKKQVVPEADGSLIHSQELWLQLWAEHFRDQFNCLISTVNLSLLLANEPKQVDISPPSGMEAIMGIGFLRSHKAAGRNGPSPSLLKHSGEVGKAFDQSG